MIVSNILLRKSTHHMAALFDENLMNLTSVLTYDHETLARASRVLLDLSAVLTHKPTLDTGCLALTL